MTSEFESRTTSVTVVKSGESLLSEYSTRIEINDEGGGEFLSISQPTLKEGIRIDPSEWPAIRNAIENMVSACRDSS